MSGDYSFPETQHFHTDFIVLIGGEKFRALFHVQRELSVVCR